MPTKVCCANCHHFKTYAGESVILTRFVDWVEAIRARSARHADFPAAPTTVAGTSPHCQHPICWDGYTGMPFHPYVIVTGRGVRVAGEAQLNHINECQYYRRKWWMLWAPLRYKTKEK